MFKVPETGMGIVRENANFRGSETDFAEKKKKKKKNPRGKKPAVEKKMKKGNKMKKKHRF